MRATDLCVWTPNGPEKIPVEMKRGIFQGDSLSPLLFCICVAPLSEALRKTKVFQADHQVKPITHLMYMDDLKVYAEDRENLEEVVRLVEEVSGAMGMELGLRKCAVAHMVHGVAVMAGGVPLEKEKEKEISELEEGGVYKYRGVAQRFGPDLRRTRQGVEKEYIARTRKVWGSGLDMRGKVEAQNMWGSGVIRYSLGTIDWPRSTMKELDRSTRRILRQNQATNMAPQSREYTYQETRGEES